LVPKTEVGGVVWAGEGEAGGRQEAEDIEPVGGTDDDAFAGRFGEEEAQVKVVWGADLEEAAVWVWMSGCVQEKLRGF
jgi:hypothetical protein